MINPIIHIGIHKTATTFLQYNYFPKLDGVQYLHGDLLFKELLFNDDIFLEKVLLSYEGFSGVAWNQLWVNGIRNDFHWILSFKKRINKLKRLLPDASLIIVFRKHGDLLISMYKQYIQEGGVLKFKDFYGESGVIRQQDLSYTYRIEKIYSLFDKVYVLSYEDFKKYELRYFDTFFEKEYGLIRNNKMLERVKINKSISGSKIEMLRNINKVYNKLPRKWRGLIRYIRWSPRDVLQNRLSFWEPKDPDHLIEAKKEVNDEMKADWDFVEKMKWKFPGVSTI